MTSLEITLDTAAALGSLWMLGWTATLQGNVASAKRDLTAAEAEVAGLREALEQAQRDFAGMRDQLGQAHREIEGLTAERDEARDYVRRMEANLPTIRWLTDQRNQAIAERDAALARLARPKRVGGYRGEADRDGAQHPETGQGITAGSEGLQEVAA